jgi:hypothetical protein
MTRQQQVTSIGTSPFPHCATVRVCHLETLETKRKGVEINEFVYMHLRAFDFNQRVSLLNTLSA